jgi:tetratricopeptide (TPR) repeat protein
MLAEMLLDRGQSDEAEGLLLQVVQAEPEHPWAHLVLGRIALQRGRFADSLDHLKRSAAKAPHVKATHQALAQVYGRLGRTPEAEEEVRRMAPLREDWYWPDPYQEEVLAVWVGQKARITLVSRLWREGQRDESLRLAQALARDYPESPKAQYMLGEKLNVFGLCAESEKPLRAALRLDPNFGKAHFELGYCLHQQGNLTEAAACYREAVRLQPDYGVAYYDLSICLAQQGDREGALQAVRQAIRYKPDVGKSYRQLGKLLSEKGPSDEAREALQRAVELDPADSQAKALLDQARSREKEKGGP